MTCDHVYVTETKYSYCDLDGNTYGRKTKRRCECGAKTFSWSQNVHDSFWAKGKPDGCLPYGAELLRRVAGHDLWIVEGEKDVQALVGQGEYAISSPDGSGSWKRTYSRMVVEYEPARVIIVADADAPGRQHAMEVAISLSRVSYRNVHVVECAHGKDVSEHLANGGTLAQILPHHVVRLSDGLSETFKAARLRSTDPKLHEYQGASNWIDVRAAGESIKAMHSLDTRAMPGDTLDPWQTRMRCGACNAYIHPWMETRTKEGKVLQGRPCYRCRIWYKTTKETDDETSG